MDCMMTLTPEDIDLILSLPESQIADILCGMRAYMVDDFDLSAAIYGEMTKQQKAILNAILNRDQREKMRTQELPDASAIKIKIEEMKNKLQQAKKNLDQIKRDRSDE